MIIMGAALLIAVIVAVVISSLPKTKPVAEVTPSLEVLVANKVLIKGEKLAAEDVHWQVWPDSVSYTGLIKKSEQADPEKLTAYGSPLRHDIEAGEPVTTQSLVLDAKGSFLSAMLGPGMRAVSIAVKGEAGGAGGFISPGDQVDVILAYSPKLSGPAQTAVSKIVQRYATQIIMRNVKVLAVDQDAKNDAHDPKVAKSVTLEVDETGEQKLALVQQMGEISLSLRRLGEKDDPATDLPPPMITDVNTIDVIKKVNKDIGRSQSDGPGYATVRMYSGNAVQNLPVRDASPQ